MMQHSPLIIINNLNWKKYTKNTHTLVLQEHGLSQNGHRDIQ